MLKKSSVNILLVSLVLLFSCIATACGAKQDTTNLENQTQKESYDFEQLINEFTAYVQNIKHPAKLNLKSVFPGESWYFELSAPDDSGFQKYYLAIPISAEIGRGMTTSKVEIDKYYITRAGKLDPETNVYIVPSWNGQPFNWGTTQGLSQEAREYPIRLELDCFKNQKICAQPLMVPPEASHGVYAGTVKQMGTESTAKLVSSVQQLYKSNPYIERSYKEQLKIVSMENIIESLSSEVKLIAADVKTMTDFTKLLESKYIEPNISSYDCQEELSAYKASLEMTHTQLTEIDGYIQKIKDWDFSNLDKYRVLKAE